MISLSTLSNTHRPDKKVQRIGRGMGSKRGKTCGRGHKGDKARQGYKQRYGHEGGQLPLYRKLPCRGMDAGRFRSEVFAINLGRLDAHFKDGEKINLKVLQEKGIAPRRAAGGLKILSQGELKKKVTIEAAAYSKAAEEKLKKAGISYQQTAIGK
ncbi:MAG: 50S ribosomal protein L15 [Verrucomicrobia bacterium]|nr:50S ribosomal protein L15 [Verrucomicrobiota bacterium]